MESFTVPTSMRALVYRGKEDLRVERIEVPRIGSDEMLVRVEVCGVCPTDIKKVLYGTVEPPRVFGHETAGVVVKVGRRVRGWSEGARVALHHHVPCLGCHFCRHGAYAQCAQYLRTGVTAGFTPAGGGFAEYVRVMPFVMAGVVRIPKGNSAEEGALLEPVNTVLKGVRRLRVGPGDVVLVAGQGPIGLIFTRLLSLHGVGVIGTDLFEDRLAASKRQGARWVESGRDPEAIRKRVDRVTVGRGVDAAVIAVASDEVAREGMALVRGGGQVLLFAHTRRGVESSLDLAGVCVDEKDLLGSYSADVTLQREVARLVFSRKLDVRGLISHRFGLERGLEAVRLAGLPRPGAMKVMIEPGLSAERRAETAKNRRKRA